VAIALWNPSASRYYLCKFIDVRSFALKISQPCGTMEPVNSTALRKIPRFYSVLTGVGQNYGKQEETIDVL